MKLFFILSVTVAMFIGCNESSQEDKPVKRDSTPRDSNVMHVQIPESACYRYIRDKDTVFLKVERFPNVVTGSLTYALYEKDRNTGDIDGKLMGDTLVANYNFLSEGNRSTRKVVFLIKGDTATEGYGDLKMVDFSKGLKLNKISCVE